MLIKNYLIVVLVAQMANAAIPPSSPARRETLLAVVPFECCLPENCSLFLSESTSNYRPLSALEAVNNCISIYSDNNNRAFGQVCA